MAKKSKDGKVKTIKSIQITFDSIKKWTAECPDRSISFIDLSTIERGPAINPIGIKVGVATVITSADVYAVVIYDNPSWEKPTSIPDPVEVQYQDSNGRAVGFHEIEFNPLFNWVDLQYSWDKKPILESFIKYCMLVLNVVPAIYLGNLSKPSFFGMLDMAISCIQEKEEYILENVKEWSAPQKTLQSTIGHATTFQAKEPVDMEDYQQWKNNKLEENLKAIEGRVEDLQGRLNDALQASETLKENLKAAEEYNNNLQDKLDVERGNFQSLKDKHEKLAGRILGVVNEASE